MSDQPSDAPRPVLVFIGVVALVALAASMFVGLSVNLGDGATSQLATSPASAKPHS